MFYPEKLSEQSPKKSTVSTVPFFGGHPVLYFVFSCRSWMLYFHCRLCNFRWTLMCIWRVLSQNEVSAIFEIFKVRAPSYRLIQNNNFLIIYKGIFLKLWSKVLQICLFSLYFSSLNLIYIKFTKMELTRFAMKLFICIFQHDLVSCEFI